jgi:hypothetical protein
MHPLLEDFCEKWVWPAAPGAPGAEFRRRITEEKCLKSWELTLKSALRQIEKDLASSNNDWKRFRALNGYAGEGVQASIKQMSAQLLTIDIGEQERYIELQRMHARQLWDECKHSKLHADVLLANGWIRHERELMENVPANAQPSTSYFGLSMMFPHIHPLARAAQHYFTEATACLGICACLSMVEDPMVRHENLSQRDEEMMHFIKGKYIIDTYCAGPENQKAVEDTVDYLRHRVKRDVEEQKKDRLQHA